MRKWVLTQGEQGLRAALRRAEARDVQDLLQGHVAAAARHRRQRKGAVAALVTAHARQRYEHLHSCSELTGSALAKAHA